MRVRVTWVDTDWWSTVTVTLAVPAVALVMTVDAFPLVVVVVAGLGVPRSLEKVTGVPSGTKPSDDVSAPPESWVRSATTTAPKVAAEKLETGVLEAPSTSHGSASMEPGTVADNAPQPGWPGPALQPNQLSVASST